MVRVKSAVSHLGQAHIQRPEPHGSVLGTMCAVKKHHVSGVSHVHPLRSVARTQLFYTPNRADQGVSAEAVLHELNRLELRLCAGKPVVERWLRPRTSGGRRHGTPVRSSWQRPNVKWQVITRHRPPCPPWSRRRGAATRPRPRRG